MTTSSLELAPPNDPWLGLRAVHPVRVMLAGWAGGDSGVALSTTSPRSEESRHGPHVSSTSTRRAAGGRGRNRRNRLSRRQTACAGGGTSGRLRRAGTSGGGTCAASSRRTERRDG